jgi:thiol-disulfide isomerase/thioredoxin
VLIQWGGNWCGWCVLLHERLKSDAGLRKLLLYEYDVVPVDIGRFDKNMDLAAQYGADLKKHGVPFLTVLDAEGKPLANQPTDPFETKGDDGKKGHDPGKLAEFLTKHQAEYRRAEDVLASGLAEAARSDRNVFLHFGAPWCGWCHRLDDWMARADIAPVLAKDFVDVKIDQDRTVGAKEVLARYNEKASGGIPWFVLLDPKGKPIITSDGPKGNVGFPAEEHEVVFFIKMMETSKKRMTEQDIEALRKSLATPPKGAAQTR